MNKGQLIEALAERADITKRDAEAVVGALFGSQSQGDGLIVETVASGDRVELVGFGIFSKAERRARMGRNPQTGEEVEIAATSVPKFKSGSKFKNAVKA